jgi:two-component system phosphoglycerate transport system sensor histidine kinase PgtB
MGDSKLTAGMSRVGIRGRLLLAFAAVNLATLLVGAGAWYLLSEAGDTVDGLSRRNLPQITATMQLAASSATLTGRAPSLIEAGAQADREEAYGKVREAMEETSKALGGIAELGVDLKSARALRDASAELAGKIEALNAAAKERLALADQRAPRRPRWTPRRRNFSRS